MIDEILRMATTSPLTVLVHYKAFGSNQMFTFTGSAREGVDLSDFNIDDLLDFIYRECNRVSGSEWIADKVYRSMSVGDEIVLIRSGRMGVERYRVSIVGFESVCNIP